MEVYAGEKANRVYGQFWFPDESIHALREFVVSIKGPLATPIGGGIRSLNVVDAPEPRPLRVRAARSATSPASRARCRTPRLTDMVVFRENTEDIYAGIEYPAGSNDVHRLIHFLQTRAEGVTGIRFPASSGIGIKPVSEGGQPAPDPQGGIQYAMDNDRKSP
jgi:isocitrate dehydrogenase